MNELDFLWEKIRSGKPFFIAEAGVNHLGSLDLGERLIKEAAMAGAHAIKFQSYKAANLCTKDAPRFWDWEGELEEDGSQFDSYSHLDSFGEAEHAELKRMCDEYDIEFMSTPFDDEATDYLDRVGINAYKIASCDVTNHPLLKHVGSKKKIVMLSTGAADLQDIRDAVGVLEKAGTDKIVIMHCNLKYPTDPDQINLSMIKSIQEEFGEKYVYGLSDHTMGVGTAVAAVAHGATLIEKHFTMNRADGGLDSAFSLEPEEMKLLVIETKRAWQSLGNVTYGPTEAEKAALVFRRSLYIAEDMNKGDALNEQNLRIIRPGLGLPPKYYDVLIGRKVTKDVKKGTAVIWDLIH